MHIKAKGFLAVIIFTLLIFIFGFYVGWNYGYIGNTFGIVRNNESEKIQRAFALIKNNFDGPFDSTKASDDSITALVKSLHDQNSYYLTQKQYQGLQAKEHGAYRRIVYKQLDKQMGYLKVFEFGSQLPSEFPTIAKQLQEQRIQKLLIDLRDNPGGDTQNFLADQFVKDGILVREKWKFAGKEDITRASGKAQFADLKIVVLVNHETSSGAEVFAGALQENKRALVIGEKTFGKGTSGKDFFLPDGSVLHLTIGEWYPPSGKYVGGKGITPDIFVKDIRTETSDEILGEAKKY